MPRHIICTVCGSEILPDEEVTLIEGPCGYKSVMHASCCIETTKLKGSDLTDKFIEENDLEDNIKVVDVPENCILPITMDIESALVTTEDEVENAIAEELSERYGYTTNSFGYEVNLEKNQIEVIDIDWDLSE